MKKLIFLLLLTSCNAPGLYKGSTLGTYAQDGVTILSTTQICKDSAILVTKTDIILELFAEEFVTRGFSSDRNKFFDSLRPRRLGCLIEEPEDCHPYGYYAGPCKNNICARKRGCAISSAFWVSRMWPPVCRGEWPEEPFCVSADAERSDEYDSDLVHEVCEMIGDTFNYAVPDHKVAYYEICSAVELKYHLSIPTFFYKAMANSGSFRTSRIK